MIDALESLQVPYMIVGSYSSNLHGIPRLTRDADIVVVLDRISINEIARCLGPAMRLDPPMSFETVTATMRYIFQVARSPFKIEVFPLSDDPHDQSRFSRRLRTVVAGREAWVPTPEDVIVTKLRWSRQGQRNKDTDDARNVMAVQGERLDWSYIHHWCDQHGTRELADRVRRSIPPLPPVE